jgi:hypothetical protein
MAKRRFDWRRVIKDAFPGLVDFHPASPASRGDGYAARRRQGAEILYQPDPAILLKLPAERDGRQPRPGARRSWRQPALGQPTTRCGRVP